MLSVFTKTETVYDLKYIFYTEHLYIFQQEAEEPRIKSYTIREKKNPIFSQSADTNGIPTRYKQQQQQQKPVPKKMSQKIVRANTYINTIK
jgi:hypothetical protein